MLLGISGSLRAGSANTRLLREAGRHWGGEFVLADIRFPLYDNDLENAEGLPEGVQMLVQQIHDAEAVVLSSPEYNQSFSGVIKNALDWVSRDKSKPWADKPVAILSAAAGRSGGARGSYALRLAMTPFRARLMSRDLLLAGAAKEFDEDGRLISERYDTDLGGLIEQLKVEVART